MKSSTGAIWTGEYWVSEWVVERAPFRARPSKSGIPGEWSVVDKDDHLSNYGLTETNAKATVERLNNLAAIAILMEDVVWPNPP